MAEALLRCYYLILVEGSLDRNGKWFRRYFLPAAQSELNKSQTKLHTTKNAANYLRIDDNAAFWNALYVSHSPNYLIISLVVVYLCFAGVRGDTVC